MTPAAADAWPGADEIPIGRQLHDIVVPQLFVLTTGLTALRRSGAVAADDTLVQDLVDTATQAMTDLRAISRGRVTREGGTLADVGARLRDATKSVEHLTDCHVEILVDGDIEIAPALADDLVAFVWEAVANAIRHGGSRRVDIVLEARGDELRVVAEDDGSWSEPTDRAASGLKGLERRARRWSGSVSVAHPVGGTRLEWCIPIGTTPR
jgi:signal transduction histidine kinase